MKTNSLILILVTAMAGVHAQAATENVDFTISGLIEYAPSHSTQHNGNPNSNVNINATITGELFGLTVGATNTAPTSIEITSITGPGASIFTAPFTFVPVASTTSNSPNTYGGFNVAADGTVTDPSGYSATFQNAASVANPSTGNDLLLQFNNYGFNGYVVTYNAVTGSYGSGYQTAYGTDTIENAGGSGGVTFSVDSVPEPSTWAMILGSVSGLVFLMRRRSFQV